VGITRRRFLRLVAVVAGSSILRPLLQFAKSPRALNQVQRLFVATHQGQIWVTENMSVNLPIVWTRLR